MRCKIYLADFEENSFRTHKIFDKYMEPVIKILEENVHVAFNLPFIERTEKTSSDAIKLERKFNVLCSPEYVLANVCRDMHLSNITSRLTCIYGFDIMRYQGQYYIMIRMNYIDSIRNEWGHSDLRGAT